MSPADVKPNHWEAIAQLRAFGLDPSTADLRAAILSGTPIPEGLRAYVATRIGDQVAGRRRGRPARAIESRNRRWRRTASLAIRVMQQEADLKAQGDKAPRLHAEDTVGREIGLKGENPGKSLRRKLDKGLRDAPPEVREELVGRKRARALPRSEWPHL